MSQDAAVSPYTLQESGDARYAFWADAIADMIEDGDPPEPIVIKGGISPSGVPHFGNMNEVALGWFVAEVLRERGHAVRQVFTADDYDPLRKVPRRLADLEGNVVGLDAVDAGALGRNLGRPYTAIPDPFGCCDSYGAHFSALIEQGATQLGADIEVVSNTELYENGDFEPVIRELLADLPSARDVLGQYQDKVDDDYVPFRPVCAACGIVTETDAVTDIDLEVGEVRYVCGDLEAGDRTIEGCGHEGTATLREGKLPWRFEWPAQWRILGVDFEPFGKDHAEGSWPSGEHVAREVLGDEPPVPMVYEWFTLDGQPFSSSEGHVILVEEVLELVEPEVARYFFATDPTTARDFSLERLDQLVAEFDRLERIYFGEAEGTEDETAFAERVYPFLVDAVREDRVRIPYRFSAVLGMFDDPDLREATARKEGHIPEDATEQAVEAALERVERASEWASRTDNAFNYELARSSIPEHDFDPAVEDALADIAGVVAEGEDGETIQGEIYEAAKRHDVGMGALFGAGYRLFLDEPDGPQLGPFLAKLDREFVVDRLRRER